MHREGNYMLNFIIDNIGSIIVSLVLVLIVFIAVRSMIKDKKSGKCSCGGSCGSCGGCSGCAMSGACCKGNVEKKKAKV